MLDCKKKIKILDGVFVEKISDNEIVAINVTTGVFASVDEVGMKILQYINQPHIAVPMILWRMLPSLSVWLRKKNLRNGFSFCF